MNNRFQALLVLYITLIFGFIGCSPKSTPTRTNAPTPYTPTNQIRLAFGSCSEGSKEDIIWESINRSNPDVWIWLGDIVYADTEDMAKMKAKYKQMDNKTEYRKLKSKADIIGIWDDHDYGVNDGDKFYPKKVEAKNELLEFLDVPSDDPIRQRAGAYSVSVFKKNNLTVKVILLDCRFFRDKLQKDPSGNARYLPNPTGDMLGAEQWIWLKQELYKNNADVHIIGSGVQVLPEEHKYEKWANMPTARQRLLDMINDMNPNNPILISGDRHIAEVSSMNLPSGKKLYEVTSSGLTHTWSTLGTEPNKYRKGKLVVKLNYGILNISKKGNSLTIDNEIRGINDQVHQKMRLN